MNTNKRTSTCFAAIASLVVLVAVASTAISATVEVPTFRITQVYSNLDGSIQFVRLTEMAGLDGQNRFAGLTLTSEHAGVTKSFTFTSDLATERTANLSIVVAATEWGALPVFDYGYQYFCCIPPQAELPARFLATDGGTIDFAGVDRMSYEALPTDGTNGLNRDGSAQPATVPWDGMPCVKLRRCQPGEYEIAPTAISVVEYYDEVRDQYFYTASAPDIEALDSGRIPGWRRNGTSFRVAASPSQIATNFYPVLTSPVCRFYIPPAAGDTHFFSASADECARVRKEHPEFVLEAEAAFYAALPNPDTGECPPDIDLNGYDRLTPVYRLWNQRADSGHRYTTSLGARGEMLRKGYVAEGYGPMGVAMCAQ